MNSLWTNKKEVKKFGIVLGIILFGIGALQWKHGNMTAASILWGLAAVAEMLALIAPMTLSPVCFVFMKIGLVLGWINTRLILILTFYLMFMPIGLVLRLFGKDLLHRQIDKKAATYWVPCDEKEHGPKYYEKQF